MTSLQLSSTIVSPLEQSVPEWGTGRLKEKGPLWSAKSPTWHLSGKPIEQYYELTQLKKSNLRPNDQLLPNPQESCIADQMIHKSFPSEHPYSSHIPRLKLLPPFALTSEDPKRGVEARRSLPLTSETPAASYDILLVNKTKGAGNRHEVQALPPDSLKKGLTWHGDQGFHQGVRVFGDTQSYYPIPPTSVVPNLMDRSDTHLAISDRTSNTTRNLERQQWKTTYDNNYTGLGPANQYKLNNLDDKIEQRIRTGQEDDDIYPWFINTYERPRPQEGRVSNVSNPNYGVPLLRGAAQENTGYIRKPTLTEREEHRLWNGKEYVSLPMSDKHDNEQWKEWSILNNPEERFSTLIEKQMRNAQDSLSLLDNEKQVSYTSNIARDHHDNIQQMEAQNRWRDLECLKPSSDIAIMERKFRETTNLAHPKVFYGQEGRYNEERAGLYKTSYEPDKLAFKLDNDPSKLNIRNTVNSASNAIQYPTDLNLNMDLIRPHSETDPRKVPMFSERPDIFEVFEPYHRDRDILKAQLQPNAANSRPAVQEREVLHTESTAGNSYNTRKFLQENKLPWNIRSEPLALMSSENQSLANVRINSTKHVKFNQEISVGEGAGSTPLLVSKASIENPKVIFYSPRAPTPRTIKPIPPIQALEPRFLAEDSAALSMQRSAETFRPMSPSKNISNHHGTLSSTDNLFLSQRGKTTVRNMFESKASNIAPMAGSFDPFCTSYKSQYHPTNLNKTSFDPRYNWEPGCGIPRPQTSLLKLQNSFSKSDTYRRLREQFPEKNPNLIDNVNKGRQHDFGTMSMNAQVLRGTLVTA